MNKAVNFEIAKLLKEKGYNIPTEHGYGINGKYYKDQNHRINYNTIPYRDLVCSAPTIAEVVMWLYEKHGIWIWVEKYENESKFVPQIPKADLQKVLGFYNSPTEAYEAAITYSLENLI